MQDMHLVLKGLLAEACSPLALPSRSRRHYKVALPSTDAVERVAACREAPVDPWK